MKKLFTLLTLTLVLFLLAGCAAENPNSGGVTDDNTTVVLAETTATRKIIYEVNMSLTSKDIETVYEGIKDRLAFDEWVDNESFGSSFSRLVLRIKSNRIDAFIDEINDNYTVSSFNKSSRDISIQYYDKATRILTLEAEQTRLLELYETATVSEMIELNQRLSEIDIELQELNGEINQYDSLIEYSMVTIEIRSTANFMSLSLPEKMWRAFTGGWDAFLNILELLLLAFLALIPFILVGVPSIWGLLKLNKYYIKKRQLKNRR